MRLRRTLTVQLTEEQAATADALGFLHQRPWADQARVVLSEWLDAQAGDALVIQAKRAKRLHLGRSRLQVVREADAP